LTLLLFHLANAALLPYAQHADCGGAWRDQPRSVCRGDGDYFPGGNDPGGIWSVGRIDKYGYWRLIMLALLIMPVRAALAASTAAPWMMVPVQILDGFAAGVLGVDPSFIVVLLRGSGHVNAGQSVVMLMQGAGAAMSPALTGMIAGHYSFATAFSVLSIIALAALLIWWRSAPTLAASAFMPTN
jgi:MFS family permease